MRYLKKFPTIYRLLWGNKMVFKIPDSSRAIFLTFDDGPDPRSTDDILKLLDQFNAKATFFCLGKKVESHQELFSQIKERGHSVGNHGYEHLNGWKTASKKYLDNAIRGSGFIRSNLFRPPYGRITPMQAKLISAEFSIIMWDFLTGDFDPVHVTKDSITQLTKKISSGSILVFHDSSRTKQKTLTILKYLLDYFHDLDFSFKKM